MDQMYYVTSRVKPSTCTLMPFHAYTDRALAVRFCEMQDLIPTGILSVPGPQGLQDEVDFVVRENAVVRVDRRSTDHGFKGRLDAFVAEHAAGLSLWHVELAEDGLIIKCLKCFSTSVCRSHHLPMPGQTSRYNWPAQRPDRFVVHCFAATADAAREEAEKVRSRTHDSFGGLTPEEAPRLRQTPSIGPLLRDLR